MCIAFDKLALEQYVHDGTDLLKISSLAKLSHAIPCSQQKIASVPVQVMYKVVESKCSTQLYCKKLTEKSGILIE